MKNLFLTCAMFLVFGSAVIIAQEVPRKSTTTSDTIGKKKTTKGSKKNSSTYKTDTVHKQHTKTNKTKTTNPATTNPTTTPRRDSIGTTRP